ncbi:MAG: chemotaxis protein CheW [Acidobacteria bacterium]|nr:chemotaxis protein CheW [Acidobacteriota bacterium]
MTTAAAQQLNLEFTMARERFALDAALIQEITEVPVVQRVPKAPAVVAGLADIRGRVVTLIDLEHVFGVDQRSEGQPVALILAPPDAHLGLLVHGQPQVVRLDLSTAEPAGGLIESTLLASDKLYNIVSPRRVLAYCEKQILDVFRIVSGDGQSTPSGRHA